MAHFGKAEGHLQNAQNASDPEDAKREALVGIGYAILAVANNIPR